MAVCRRRPFGPLHWSRWGIANDQDIGRLQIGFSPFRRIVGGEAGGEMTAGRKADDTQPFPCKSTGTGQRHGRMRVVERGGWAIACIGKAMDQQEDIIAQPIEPARDLHARPPCHQRDIAAPAQHQHRPAIGAVGRLAQQDWPFDCRDPGFLRRRGVIFQHESTRRCGMQRPDLISTQHLALPSGSHGSDRLPHPVPPLRATPRPDRRCRAFRRIWPRRA